MWVKPGNAVNLEMDDGSESKVLPGTGNTPQPIFAKSQTMWWISDTEIDGPIFIPKNGYFTYLGEGLSQEVNFILIF